jgi:hypothetical protein
MGSISTLGDLTLAGPPDSSFSAPVRHIPPTPPVGDQVQIATIPSWAQVERLQGTSPSSLNAVLDDAIIELKTAALQSADPAEVQYLSDLADRLQLLQDAQANSPFIATQNLTS